MRQKLYFDGQPNRFQAMRKLFNEISTLKVKPGWSTPLSKVRLFPRHQSTGQRRWRAA